MTHQLHEAPDAHRSSIRHWLILVLIGAIGGLLSGLFAVGGGIIMVPDEQGDCSVKGVEGRRGKL